MELSESGDLSAKIQTEDDSRQEGRAVQFDSSPNPYYSISEFQREHKLAIKCPNCHFENSSDAIYCGQCGTALTKTPRSRPGSSHRGTFDSSTETLEIPGEELRTGTLFARRYQIIEKLGKGGMGKVYKVLDREIDTKVALKLINPEIAADRRTIERFRNELKIARGISHKNVNRMYALDREDTNYYITMEYVPGEDLKNMIRMTKRLSVATAVGISKQVCEGLAEANRLGVVHRDIKPSNIMIDKDGNAKIMDFGLAQSVRGEARTDTGVMIGTPAYMSPEQADGKEIDHRSDIYSLGVVMFEMVTGRLPFEGDTPLNMAIKHKMEKPPDPKEINIQIPDDLNRAILRCLEKDKEKRFQSAGELFLELEEIEKGMSVNQRHGIGREKVRSEKTPSTLKKSWMMIAALFVVTVVAVIIVIGIRHLRKEAATSPSKKNMLVVLPFENLGFTEDDYFADGITEEVTNRLAALHGLGVISRTSAVQYKKTSKTIKQIGEELGVDYVLEGTVRWERSSENKGRVRITPQLIRVSNDTHIWSEHYDRVIEDIFSVQSEIADEVTKQLDIIVLEPERAALRARPTKNLEAYDCYLQAIKHYNLGYLRQDAKEYEQTIEQLEKAVKLDPNFVYAYYILFFTHSQLYDVGIDRTQERLAKSRNAIDKMLELRPDMPEAQWALASYYMRAFQDYDRAIAIYESVQRARPNFPPSALAGIQQRQGKWEQSIANYEKAFKLNPRSFEIAHILGRSYAWIGKYEESERWFDRALSIYPDLYYSKLGKARLPMLSRGDTKETRALLEKLPPHRLTEYNWWGLCLLERSYKEGLDGLAASSSDSFSETNFYIPLDLAYAAIYHATIELSLMRTRANSARLFLEKAVAEHPEDPRFHASLGLAYAYLGWKEQAIQEGNQAVNLYPVSADAFNNPLYVLNLARVYTIVGEYEQAISQLEYLLSIPSGNTYSVALLRIDPQWDPLRSHPRFQSLLKENPSAKVKSAT